MGIYEWALILNFAKIRYTYEGKDTNTKCGDYEDNMCFITVE
jgi:hypothetical protein